MKGRKRKQVPVDFYCDYVLSGRVKVEKVEETDRVLAYFHTKPYWTFHVVVVPKEHVVDLVDMDDVSLIQEVFEVIQKVIERYDLVKEGYKVITNGGKFQELDSKHLHFHVLSGERAKVATK